MNAVSTAAVFFIVWWLVFFTVLPFGAHSQADAEEITLGTEHGAPARLKLGRKAAITTVIAALVTGVLYLVFGVAGLSLEDLII